MYEYIDINIKQGFCKLISTEEYIILDIICIYDRFRYKGFGSLLLTKVINYSKLCKKNLVLITVEQLDSCNTLSFNNLNNWYLSRGFVLNKDYPDRIPYSLIYINQ